MRPPSTPPKAHPPSITGAARKELLHRPEAVWRDRPFLLSAGAEALRPILIDRAARGDARPALLALDLALGRLENLSPRLRRIAECRYFGAMTHEEVAVVLEIPVAAASRRWRLARAWLVRELSGDGP